VNEAAVDGSAAAFGTGRVHSGVVKVRHASLVDEFFKAAKSASGPVTIAVVNAGVFPNCPLIKMPVEGWDRAMETSSRERSSPVRRPHEA
jgi:NAD(P)-dependent dehydrogenase (short-subunit alcohol dehydrogenase family)